VTAISDPLFYLLAVPAVVALGLSKGGFSGVGQMATPLLVLVMPPLEAAAIFLPIMIVQDCFALWVYRKDWDRRVLAIMMPGIIVGVGLAWVLASYISDAAVRVFITTIAYVLYAWIGPSQVAHKAGRANAAKGVFLGAVSGFTSTLCQAGAPPYQMYALSQKLPKMTYVGTSAIYFAVMNWLKVVPYLALGQFSMKGFWHVAAAAATRDPDQSARLLGGADHTDGGVLPHYHDHPVPDFARTYPQRHDGYLARVNVAIDSEPPPRRCTRSMRKAGPQG